MYDHEKEKLQVHAGELLSWCYCRRTVHRVKFKTDGGIDSWIDGLMRSANASM